MPATHMTEQFFAIDGMVAYADGRGYPHDLDASEDTPGSGSSLNVPDLLLDGFESGDMSAPNGGGGINTVGFSWSALNKTSVVNSTHVIWNSTGTVSVPAPAGRDWNSKTGNNSVRFRYPAGDNWTEQRYAATVAQPVMYLGYWIRVPTNYVRGNPGAQINNKWFDILWGDMGQYENALLPRIEMRDLAGASGAADMHMQLRNRNNAINGWAGSNTYSNFMTPADAGRWMHCVYFLGQSSGPDVADGKLRFWRRWENESSYTLINSINDGVIFNTPGQGAPGWSGGYVMGYANNPYTADTEFLLDEFSWWSTDPSNGALTP